MQKIKDLNHRFFNYSFSKERFLVMKINEVEEIQFKQAETPEELNKSREILEQELLLIKGLINKIGEEMLPFLDYLENELQVFLIDAPEDISKINKAIACLRVIFGKKVALKTPDIYKHINIPTDISKEFKIGEEQRKSFMAIHDKFLNNKEGDNGFIHQINGGGGFSTIIGGLGLLKYDFKKAEELEEKTELLYKKIKTKLDILESQISPLAREKDKFISGEINIGKEIPSLKTLNEERELLNKIETTKEAILNILEDDNSILEKTLHSLKERFQAFIKELVERTMQLVDKNKIINSIKETINKIDSVLPKSTLEKRATTQEESI